MNDGMTLNERKFGETLGFDIDDGTGLRVAQARFESETKFSWSLFDGYDRIRILTYSAGVGAIVRLLDRHGFSDFECVFGCESTLRTLKDIMAFQQVAIGDTRAAIKNLSDERHAFILSRVREGQARFRVLRKQIAHAKLYLLENTESGKTRALIGSANLSETAFGGRQSETLVCFDEDESAWRHYLAMYESIRDQSSDEIPLPPERVEQTEIKLHEVPVLDPTDLSTLVIETPETEQKPGNIVHFNIPAQIERIEKVKAAIPPVIANIIPPPRNGKQQVTRELRRQIVKEYSRIRVVQSEDEADHRELSIDRHAKIISLFGEPFPWKAIPPQREGMPNCWSISSATTRVRSRVVWESRGSSGTTSYSGPGFISHPLCATCGRWQATTETSSGSHLSPSCTASRPAGSPA